MGQKLSLFKRIVAKKASDTKAKWFTRKEKAKERIDRDFPLDIRIGSKLSISSMMLLLNKDVALMDAFPKEMYVLNYGMFNLLGLKHHRFYLGEVDEAEAILQIVELGNELECRIFTTFDEVYPDDAELWDVFLGDDEQLIGAPVFTNNDNEVDYFRMWEESDNWIRPFKCVETIWLDAFGEESVTVDHECMLYARPIDENDDSALEYLFVSAEDRLDEAMINMMLGIDIIPTSIKVAF